jgi:membrane associated rhomboid family serine protease/antitoxin component YwqK of YwqJK toxin-antitoxin module
MMIRKYPVTFLLILVNGLVFAFFALKRETIMFSEYEDFVEIFWFGANFNPFTLGGEPWRLITSMFLHGNIFHLAMNMYGLYMIGRAIEEQEGPAHFFFIYMITGVAGGLASLSFNLFSSSVGASGAVFGLYGFQIVDALILHRRDRDILISIILNFVIFAAINTAIAISMSSGALGFTLDTAAHLGGLAFGALLALWRATRFHFAAPLLLVVTLGVFSLQYVLPKDQVYVYRAFQTLLTAEKHENELFTSNISDHQLADSLKTTFTMWDDIEAKLDQIPWVHPELRHDTLVLKGYAALRRLRSQYTVLLIEKESYVYLDSQEVTDYKLDTLPRLQHRLNVGARGETPTPEPEAPPSPAFQTVTVYYDSNWREVPDYAAVYYRIGPRDSLGRWQGKVRDYYHDGKIQMKGAYKDGLSHGVFLYYSHQGKYESAGRYDRESPVGKWEEFHKNGRLQRETVFGDRVFIRNVYDTAGNPQVVNGRGMEISYHPNGVVSEQGQIQNGRKEGIWKGYHANGNPYFEEYYSDNMLVKGMSIDASGNRHIYDQSSFYASPQIGLKAYSKYLSDNIRKEGLPFKEGEVKLIFSVDKDGTLHDFVVMKSVCGPCDQEAIRLVQQGPPWRPALSRGHEKTSSKGFVDVNF